MPEQDISEVADGVFLVRGSQVNWYLVRDGRAVTLVDSGYPADAGRVEASVRHIGARPEDITALLITHAHTDHIGAANHLHSRYGTPMYLHPSEVPHAQRQYLEQISLGAVIVRAWRPRMLRWARHAIAAGGTADVAAAHAQPLPPAAADGALDLPGRPVPVFTPGHTSGHTAYLLPHAGAVLTGDALVTSHPTTGTPHGPQLIATYFQHDDARARTSLDALATLPARLVLPGHGEPWKATWRPPSPRHDPDAPEKPASRRPAAGGRVSRVVPPSSSLLHHDLAQASTGPHRTAVGATTGRYYPLPRERQSIGMAYGEAAGKDALSRR